MYMQSPVSMISCETRKGGPLDRKDKDFKAEPKVLRLSWGVDKTFRTKEINLNAKALNSSWTLDTNADYGDIPQFEMLDEVVVSHFESSQNEWNMHTREESWS